MSKKTNGNKSSLARRARSGSTVRSAEGNRFDSLSKIPSGTRRDAAIKRLADRSK